MDYSSGGYLSEGYLSVDYSFEGYSSEGYLSGGYLSESLLINPNFSTTRSQQDQRTLLSILPATEVAKTRARVIATAKNWKVIYISIQNTDNRVANFTRLHRGD